MPTGRTSAIPTRTRGVALAALVLVSMLAGTGLVGSAGAVPGGLARVPADQVAVDLPSDVLTELAYSASELEDRLEGSIYASTHADTLEVTVTTPDQAEQLLGPDVTVLHGDGPIAVVIADDVHDDGRKLTLDAGLLEDLLGYRPEVLYGTHDDGSEWEARAEYEDGLLLYDVPHFSTNSVTFSETVSLSGTPGDGATFSYGIEDLDAASNLSIALTGAVATEWDNRTAGTLGNGETFSLDVAGNADPSGPAGEPVVRFTGVSTPYDAVADLADYSGDAGYVNVGDDANNDALGAALEIVPNTDGTLTEMTFHYKGSRNDGTSKNYEIWIDSGTADSTYKEGTEVRSSFSVSSSSLGEDVTVSFSTSTFDVQAGQTYEVQIVPTATDFDSTKDTIKIQTYPGASQTRVFGDGAYAQGAVADLVFDGASKTSSPSLDLDGDGTAEASVGGTLSNGQTVERTLSSLTTGSYTPEVTVTGVVDVEVLLEERSLTEDPTVVVNGNTTSYSGALVDGETVTLSTSKNWLQEGTNTVEVQLPDVSADAPQPVVGFDYGHDVTSNRSVDVSLGRWVERYNISRTYQSERAAATLEIPLVETAVDLGRLEYRVDGGEWTDVPQASRAFDGTTVRVDVDELTTSAGVPAGTTVGVRATATRVLANNASVTVVNMTAPTEALDTKVRVDAWTNSSYLAVDETRLGDRLHDAYRAEWEADPYVVVDAGGDQHLHLPNAEPGLTTRVRTVPVDVTPATGDVQVSVVESGTPLVLEVAGGPSGTGDDVTFRYLPAVDGERYLLWATGAEVVRDSATASSPVALEDDDSAETLEIRLEEETATTAGAGGGGMLPPLPSASGSVSVWGNIELPLVVLAGALGVAALYLVARRTGLAGSASRGASGTASAASVSVPSVGRLSVPVVGGVTTALSRTVRTVLGSGWLLVGAAGLAVTLGVATGTLSLPAGSGVVVLVAGVATASYLALRQLGAFDRGTYLVIVAGTALIGLAVAGGGVIDGLLEALRPVLPLVAIGGLYVAYRAVSGPDTVRRFVVRGGEDE